MEKYVVCTIINKHCRSWQKNLENFQILILNTFFLKFPSYESSFFNRNPLSTNISTMKALKVAKSRKLFSISCSKKKLNQCMSTFYLHNHQIVSPISNSESTNIFNKHSLWFLFNWQTYKKSCFGSIGSLFSLATPKLRKNWGIGKWDWWKHLMNSLQISIGLTIGV